jgi:hypothetical protein
MVLEPSEGSARDKIELIPMHLDEDAGERRFKLGDSVLSQEETVAQVRRYFAEGYPILTAETDSEVTRWEQTPRGVTVSTQPRADVLHQAPPLVLDEQALLQDSRSADILTELGVLTPGATVRRKQENKLIQVRNFVNIAIQAVRELHQDSLTIVDAASGKAYLSFILYHFLRHKLNYDVRLYGIDSSADLIEKTEAVRAKLGLEGVTLVNARVEDFEPPGEVDLLAALHACDTATDQALALGVRAEAKRIILVPCCQFELREQLGRDHPMSALTRYGLLEDTFAAMLTDGLRAMALEAFGYRVEMRRFVTDDISTKNRLILARANKSAGKGAENALRRFRRTCTEYGVNPAIMRLLPELSPDRAEQLAAEWERDNL